MESKSAESDRPVLEYRTPPPTAERAPASTSAGALGGFSLLCVAVPIVGYVIRNGPMFLFGLPLSLVGAGLGVGAIVVSAKASRVSALGILGTVGNGLTLSFFVWLFVVRGLC
jgi:hypothetical protein